MNNQILSFSYPDFTLDPIKGATSEIIRCGTGNDLVSSGITVRIVGAISLALA